MGGADAARQWDALSAAMQPLQRGAATFPAAALRGDLGVLLTAARFAGPQLAMMGLMASTLTVRMRVLGFTPHLQAPWLHMKRHAE
jgi:hypothetical protein